MSRIKDLPSASSLSLSDYLAVDQALGTKKTTVEGLANKVGEVIGRNDNLLLNGWFTVNQRGQTSYSTALSYCLDRWYMIMASNGGTVSLINDGIRIVVNSSITLAQILEIENELLGKKLTLSIMESNGTITSDSFTVPSTIPSANTNIKDITFSQGWTLRFSWTSNHWRISILSTTQGASVDVRAVKLEIGEISTLAYDVAPNYTEELLKCQRYFLRMGTDDYGIFAARNSTTAYGVIYLPTPLRISSPTISRSGTWNLYQGTTEIAISNITNGGCHDIRLTLLVSVASGLTAGNALRCVCSGGGYIDLDAEIY